MDGWFLGVGSEHKNNSNESVMSRKYHYFESNRALCGRYQQDANYFENGIESGEILKLPHFACKKCYEKWRKRFNV